MLICGRRFLDNQPTDNCAAVIGQKLDNWVIEAEIGRGAMGEVYRAHALDTPDQPVALKVLARELARESHFQLRFQREIDILRKLTHPHIVKLLGSGLHINTAYFVMEYVDGTDLDKQLRSRTPSRLDWAEVVVIALQACSALRHAHERGILHHDLKPSNLLQQADGTIKLCDFGVAKLLARPPESLAGSMVGNVTYLAPECAQGKPVSRRSDLYALGGVLYTLLAGRPPFVGRTVVEVVHKHCHTLPEHIQKWVPEIPNELGQLVMRMLAKKPSERLSDAGSVLEELESIRSKAQRQGRWPSELGGAVSITIEPVESGPVERLVDWPVSEHYRPLTDRLNWWDRPAVKVLAILTGLAVCVSLIVMVLLGWHQPSPETLYSKALPLLTSGDPDDLERAWSEYLDKMEQLYPDHPYQAELLQARQQRQDLAQQRAALASTKPRQYSSEAERLYQLGVRAYQTGDGPTAERVWSKLVEVYGPIRSQRRWVELAESALRHYQTQATPRQTSLPSLSAVEEVLLLARQLREQGQAERADALLRALEELYRDDVRRNEVQTLLKRQQTTESSP